MKLATDSPAVTATVSFVDSKGNPALVEGAPVWATDRPDLLTVTTSSDGSTASVVAVGPLGNAQVSCTADADLGSGVVPVIALGDVEVVAGQAVAGVINFSTP